MSGSTGLPERVVIGLSHGADEPERVLIAYLMGIEALRAGKQVLMWLTSDAVRLGIDGIPASIHLRGGPSIEELHDEFTGRGGLFYACPQSVHLRDLAGEAWIRHAEVKGTQSLYAYMRDGAIVFHA